MFQSELGLHVRVLLHQKWNAFVPNLKDKSRMDQGMFLVCYQRICDKVPNIPRCRWVRDLNTILTEIQVDLTLGSIVYFPLMQCQYAFKYLFDIILKAIISQLMSMLSIWKLSAHWAMESSLLLSVTFVSIVREIRLNIQIQEKYIEFGI